MKITSLALLLAFPLAACTSNTLTRTGWVVPPKPQNCRFDIVTSMPAEPLREIGTIDVDPGMGGGPTTLGALKREIASDVCRAGGDVAIASANGFGMYLKVSVMQRIAPAAAQATLTSAPAPATEGCKFDTQCKGDRVCTAGVCVDPQKK